jgi:DNA repair protein RecO (recombination protein O)
MLHKTRGIVLRAVKYGESSLVVTIFTAQQGVAAYMVKGVRSASARSNRAGTFHPAALLELVVYQQAEKNMQYLREYNPAYIYQSVQENVVKNTIVLFSTEILLRMLPERAPLPALFDFAFEYFVTLDKSPLQDVGNYPLFFIIRCSSILGYELTGTFCAATPYLNLQEGGFTTDTPAAPSAASDEDAKVLSALLVTETYSQLKDIPMNAAMRLRLTDWYIMFLQQHTQHMGNIRSLPVLRTILH